MSIWFCNDLPKTYMCMLYTYAVRYDGEIWFCDLSVDKWFNEVSIYAITPKESLHVIVENLCYLCVC